MVAYATLNICFKNVCWFQQWDQLKSAMTKLETATLITSVACALKRIVNGRLARHYSMCLTPLILTLLTIQHLNWYANESPWWSLNCKQSHNWSIIVCKGVWSHPWRINNPPLEINFEKISNILTKFLRTFPYSKTSSFYLWLFDLHF